MSTAELFASALALKPKARGELLNALIDSFLRDARSFANTTAAEIKQRSVSNAPHGARAAATTAARTCT